VVHDLRAVHAIFEAAAKVGEALAAQDLDPVDVLRSSSSRCATHCSRSAPTCHPRAGPSSAPCSTSSNAADLLLDGFTTGQSGPVHAT
jgi:hypothetical protein